MEECVKSVEVCVAPEPGATFDVSLPAAAGRTPEHR